MKTSCVILVALCSFVCPVAAQTAPRESRPTIRTTASEVVLDIVVRDKQGRTIKNLKPSEVEVFEDGVRQDIRSFRFANRRDGKQPTESSAYNGSSRTIRALNPICVVFHNLDPVNRKRAMETVEEFLEQDIPDSAYIGLFHLEDALAAVHPFTTDRTQVLKAIRSGLKERPVDFARALEPVLTASPTRVTVNATANSTTRTASVSVSRIGGDVSRTAIIGADVATGAGANALRGDQVLERTAFSNIAGMRETDRMNTMIDEFAVLPGRKTILLVTTGLITTGDPERFKAMLARANRAGETIYAVDVTGLNETSTARAANIGLGEMASVSRSQTQVTSASEVATGTSSLAAMKQKSLQGENMRNAVRTSDTQASLRALADGTGGFLIANTSDFRKPFQRIVQDIDAHYEALYKPRSDANDGRLRRIEVKLARADLIAETRTGYFAMPAIQGDSALHPFETIALAALNIEPRPQSFPFRTAVFRFQNSGGDVQSALAIELPGTTLTARPNPEQKTNALHASVLALIKDAAGNVVDKFSTDAPYEIPEASLGAVRSMPLTYTYPLTLPVGRYSVETAVLDREGQRASVKVINFENAELREGLQISSIVLVQRIEAGAAKAARFDPLLFQGNRIVPLLSDSLVTDAKPFVYFVVYPNTSNTDQPKVHVEFLVDGKTIASQIADLPAPDASGAIPMVVRAATHVGKCELRITAVQAAESATNAIVYAVSGS